MPNPNWKNDLLQQLDVARKAMGQAGGFACMAPPNHEVSDYVPTLEAIERQIKIITREIREDVEE